MLIRFLILPLAIVCFQLSAQVSATERNEFIDVSDFSKLWVSDSINLEYDGGVIKRFEPLGYIGDNYQRFYIHFISSIRNANNRSEYFIYGKTKVGENICSFQGIIHIDSLILYDRPLIEGIEQGYVIGTYQFYQDPDEHGSGILSGDFKSHFYRENNEIKYDAIEVYADGYENNQFEGVWKSYNSYAMKKCNWGDVRIPDSSDLDIGAGEFIVNENFANNGWENFIIASDICCNKNDPAVQKAYSLESKEWWKDD